MQQRTVSFHAFASLFFFLFLFCVGCAESDSTDPGSPDGGLEEDGFNSTPDITASPVDGAGSEDSIQADIESTESDTVANPPTGSLAINEVVCSPESGEDWFEVVAIGDSSVLLSDYRVVDDNDSHEPVSLPEVTLEPGEFYVVYAVDANDEFDGPSVGFKLGKSDGLWLTMNGEEQDSISWDGDAPEGTSYGRLPDGEGVFQTLKPTPGAPNEAFEGALPLTTPFVTDRVIPVEVELSAEAWAAIKAAPLEEEWHEGTLIFDGMEVASVGVRVKGNSSLMSVAGMGIDRFSFKVDLNRYVQGQDLLGVQMLVLNNGFKDPSLIREHLAYELAREMGLPASRTGFVDLTVAGIHLGFYTLIEHVDDEFLESNFDSDDGDMYKPELPDGNLLYEGESIADYGNVGVETNEDTTDHAAFFALVSALADGSDEDIEAILHVEQALKYLAFNTLLVNLDSYNGMGHNYYLYLDGDRFVVIPWDLNEAFGNFTCGCNREGIIDFYIDESSCGFLAQKPLIERLMSNGEWRNEYHGYLETYLAGAFSEDQMQERIHSAADVIRSTVEADTTKFYQTDQFETSLVEDVNNVIGLETFVVERGASIAAQINGSLPASGDGDGNCGTNTGPGPGPGSGGNPKCPDGICDAFEQANPNACPEDCQ